MLFRPDQSSIGRLVNRKKNGKNTAKVSRRIRHSKDWNGHFQRKPKNGMRRLQQRKKWEKQMSDLTSVFLPAKEILSNAWNLDAAVKMGNVEFG